MSLIDDEAMVWALQHSDGQPCQAERQAFQAWYDADVRHKGAYVRALAIQNAVARATVQDDLRLGAPAPLAPGGRRRWLAYGAAAAGVAGLAVLGLRARSPAAEPALELATAKGEMRTVPLADQSVATINSGSHIVVLYTGAARQVSVATGEAWFQVARDRSKPFTVAAGRLRVQALGTAFAVRRHGEGAEVLVTEGTVAVWTGERGQRHTLSAGERAMLSASGGTMTVARDPLEVQRRLAWREGKLVFMNQSLKDAVADFNRYSARPIVIADARLEQAPLIGQYRLDAPERFARDVSATLKVPYFVTERQIVIGRAS